MRRRYLAERRYKAFLSYSHRDKRIAEWLHRQLENYRLPAGIDLPEFRDGIRPIFKDRDELPASDNLGSELEAALAHSDALIVLCSPNAAISPWIAKEIDLFKRLNGDGRVFPAVVDGDPPFNMPPPLLVHYEDGTPTDTLAEPIAADLRPGEDGRKLGVQKLVAGLTGAALDELVDRHGQERHRRMAIVAALSFLGMVVAIGLALFALQQRDTARAERGEANGLIEFMLTDLREELEPVGRLDLLDTVGERAMEYYSGQRLEDLTTEELARRSRAVQLVAEMHNRRGDNEQALPAFREAARTTSELLARNPDDPDALFAHGQSEFWVGYIAWQRGENAAARRALEEYARISTRLAAMDPGNLDWQMEESYALSNLGTLAGDEGRHEDALPLFEKSVAIARRVAERKGRPPSLLVELGLGLSWVATTRQELFDFEGSARTRRQEIALYEEVLEADPGNSKAQQAALFAKGRLGWLMSLFGRDEEARAAFDDAARLARILRERDPDDTVTTEMAITVYTERARHFWRLGLDRRASQDFDMVDRLLTDLQKRDPENRDWAVDTRASLELTRALSDRSQMPADEMRRLALKWLGQLDPSRPNHRLLIVAAHLLDGTALSRKGQAADAAAAYARAIAIETDNIGATALRAVAAQRIGQTALAGQLRRRLAQMKVDPSYDDRLPPS